MKENVKLLKENVEYKMLNGVRRKYNLYQVDNTIVSRDCSMDMQFDERYRPRVIDEIIMIEQHKKQFRGWIKKGIIPDTLMYEPKGGTGKTTMSQVLAQETNADFLCLSANINRGISAITEKVVPFCENKTMLGTRKLVFIEEIGDATSAQVDSLKSVIDKYSSNVSLILTTNSLANISPALLKRFKLFDFSKFTEDQTKELTLQVFNRIKAILDIEGVEYTQQDIVYVLKKYKLSFREIIRTIGISIFDNKLDIEKMEATLASNNDIFKGVNDQDYDKLAELSSKVNPMQFLEDLNNNYIMYLTDKSMIMPFIMSLNVFQNEMNSNVPFPTLSFMNFCSSMIRDGIKFKV